MLFLLSLLACPGPTEDDSAGSEWQWDLPSGFPEPHVPSDNPMSAAKAELGRYLFYDVRLSGNETQSCGTCHLQERAFTDGLAHAEGSTGEIHRRSAMALGNVAYYSTLTWGSDVVRTLEDQALLPMFGEHPVELGLAGREAELLDRLASDPDYVARFAAAFPGEADPIQLKQVTAALACFERTLVTANSPYDRYTYQDDRTALSDAALRGMGLFQSENLECFHCHGGFAFADSVRTATSTFEEMYFHNTGLYNVDGQGAYPASDQGLIELTQVPEDMGRFRAPSLRNIALTAPYMHDGSAADLDAVLDHYAAGGRTIESGENAGDGSTNPYQSEFVQGFTLTEQDRADLKAFLESLTDPDFVEDPRFADPFGTAP